MTTLFAILFFIGGAGMLFGTSNMLPNADPAMNAPLRRLMMQTLVSLVVLGTALFVVWSHIFDAGAKPWAYGSAGMVVGYWLKYKSPATHRADSEA